MIQGNENASPMINPSENNGGIAFELIAFAKGSVHPNTNNPRPRLGYFESIPQGHVLIDILQWNHPDVLFE